MPSRITGHESFNLLEIAAAINLSLMVRLGACQANR